MLRVGPTVAVRYYRDVRKYRAELDRERTDLAKIAATSRNTENPKDILFLPSCAKELSTCHVRKLGYTGVSARPALPKNYEQGAEAGELPQLRVPPHDVFWSSWFQEVPTTSLFATLLLLPLRR